MMIGHLGVAGVAELAVSAGLIAYLQRSGPTCWPGGRAATRRLRRSAWQSMRTLWYGLAALVVATPVGLIAAETAWGSGASTIRQRAGAPGDRAGVGRYRATAGRPERA